MFRGEAPLVSGQGRQQRPERSYLWRVKHLPQRLAFGKGEMPHQRLRIDHWRFPVRQDPTIPIDAGDSGHRRDAGGAATPSAAHAELGWSPRAGPGRVAVTSTLVAGLELARAGVVT